MRQEIQPDGLIKRIVESTFPEYQGRKFYLSGEAPSRLDSYWDGGSRDYFCFYHLDQGRVLPVEGNHPAYEPGPRDLRALPARIVLVEHSIFCGKDAGITIYANPEDLAPVLPAPGPELTEDEKKALAWTRALISSARRPEAQRAGWSMEKYEAVKAGLKVKGLMNNQGALTMAGRNVAQGLPL